MRAIGIDPGFHGGMAVLGHEDCAVLPMPVFKTNGKFSYDAKQVYEILMSWSFGARVIIGLEHTRRFPKLAEGTGLLRGLAELVCSNNKDWKVVLIRPQVWQKHFRIKKVDKKTDRKKRSLKLARSLFPKLKHDLRMTKDDGKAEALLISRYLQEVY